MYICPAALNVLGNRTQKNTEYDRVPTSYKSLRFQIKKIGTEYRKIFQKNVIAILIRSLLQKKGSAANVSLLWDITDFGGAW